MVGKKLFITLVFAAAMAIVISGCESDGSSSKCPELVDFTVACYEDLFGREPPGHHVDSWRGNCEEDHHSAGCLNCAMDQTCDDYIYNSEYVYDTLCADACP